jgi:hypothetical protein
MEEKRTKMDNDDYQYISASLNTQDEKENSFRDQDPFNKSWDMLKDFSGLEQNFRRRTARNLNKFADVNNAAYLDSANVTPSGVDASSKQINPGTVYRNGYGLFDVITPPYNLYELANFYDTSFANHAAIDAKVANIVGLGYSFEATDRTMLSFEGKEQTATDKARKRIERMKLEMRDWLENLNDDDSFTKTMEKVYTDVESTGNGYLEIGRTVNGNIGYVGHIPSTTIRVRRLRDGYMQIISQKIVYFRNFGATNPNPVTEDPRPNESRSILH